MEVKYDRDADAVYVHLVSKAYAYGKDLDDERRIDYAADTTPVGVELLCVSTGVNLDSLPHADEMREALRKEGIRTYTMTRTLPLDPYPENQWLLVRILLDWPTTIKPDKPSLELAMKEVTA